jgi:hypothetical protein
MRARSAVWVRRAWHSQGAPGQKGVICRYLAVAVVVLVFNAKSGAKSRHDMFGFFFRLVPGVVTLRRHQN